MEPWMQKLNQEIGDILGEDRLSHYQITVLPQIFADFFKMLKDQPLNKVMKEQYRMENGEMEIEFSGVKKTNTDVRILEVKARRVL